MASGRLDGKVALITGGAKGLGEADARLFAQEGATVIVADTDQDAGERLAREIGGQTSFASLDVRSEAAFKGVIEQIMAEHGRLDILVNNAGVIEAGTPETVTEADYRFIMAVNVDGMVFGCKHALPAISASGGGSIINMASVGSIQGVPYCAAYSAAKGAIEAYTRVVAVHSNLKKLNVRCNSVHPGGFATPMLRSMPAKLRSLTAPGADYTRPEAGTAGDMAGDPLDVARLVLFLASDESRHMNGQRLVIDNGAVVTPVGVSG